MLRKIDRIILRNYKHLKKINHENIFKRQILGQRLGHKKRL